MKTNAHQKLLLNHYQEMSTLAAKAETREVGDHVSFPGVGNHEGQTMHGIIVESGFDGHRYMVLVGTERHLVFAHILSTDN